MPDIKMLVQKALDAKQNAYAPYSGFHVGACLITQNGDTYSGCNIENASYGATCCAERTAIFKAVSKGERKFSAIAIASDSEEFTFPCGICRQVMAEFKILNIIVANNKGEYAQYTIEELLPNAFTSF